MQGVQAFDARLTLFFCNLHTPHSKALAQKKEKKKIENSSITSVDVQRVDSV